MISKLNVRKDCSYAKVVQEYQNSSVSE